MPVLPEMILNFHWLLSNPIDLNGLKGDMWAWVSVPNIKQEFHGLLALLKKHKVSATFFVSGVCAEQNRDEILRTRDEGHEIGLHGYKHVPYDMPLAEMERDLFRAISIFRDMGVNVKGFRAPWLISSRNVYRAAQALGLTYMSSIKAKNGPRRVDEYGLVELPIYLEDQVLLQKNPVRTLLDSSKDGRVFEFHLLYVRQTRRILDEYLNKVKIETTTLSRIAEEGKGLGLSFDIAYLNRVELLKKLIY